MNTIGLPLFKITAMIQASRLMYALKTANMYWQMHEDAEKKFADVGGTWLSGGLVFSSISDLSAQI